MKNSPPQSASVLLLEQTPRWESELLRRFPHAGSRLQVCREPEQVETILQQSVPSLCLLTLSVNAESSPAGNVLHLITRIRSEHPQVEIVVVWSGDESALEWPLREQGVQFFLKDTQASADRIAQLCAARLQGAPHDLADLLPPESRW